MILMFGRERLNLKRKGVFKTGTREIPVPAMFRSRTVLGSFRTLMMESVFRGLKDKSIFLTLTRMLASEGMTLMLLWEILRVSRLTYWFCKTLTGISVNRLCESIIHSRRLPFRF